MKAEEAERRLREIVGISQDTVDRNVLRVVFRRTVESEDVQALIEAHNALACSLGAGPPQTNHKETT